jgi:hypothetical protein
MLAASISFPICSDVLRLFSLAMHIWTIRMPVLAIVPKATMTGQHEGLVMQRGLFPSLKNGHMLLAIGLSLGLMSMFLVFRTARLRVRGVDRIVSSLSVGVARSPSSASRITTRDLGRGSYTRVARPQWPKGARRAATLSGNLHGSRSGKLRRWLPTRYYLRSRDGNDSRRRQR